MSVTVKEIKVASCDGKHRLSGAVYIPDGKITAIYHIVHGMTEHIGRYQRIMNDLASRGYLCVGYDNLGHGNTVNEKSELGYIADKNGWELLAKDVAVFAHEVKKEFGEDLPYYLMGHSMGSFIVRLASEKFFRPDKLIIMGTCGPNPAAAPGLAVVGLVKLFKGGRYISKLLDDLAFGSYNKKFSDEDSNGKGWLTTDLSIREKYCSDDFCTFKFTVSAMGDLIKLMKYSNRSSWFKNIPNDMPIIILSGEDDPVGNYGNGIRIIHQKLKKHGKKVSCILYKKARHEILNDFTYEEVLKDIISFIE